jgi:hypothetical protein
MHAKPQSRGRALRSGSLQHDERTKAIRPTHNSRATNDAISHTAVPLGMSIEAPDTCIRLRMVVPALPIMRPTCTVSQMMTEEHTMHGNLVVRDAQDLDDNGLRPVFRQ